MDLRELLAECVRRKASDLHLKAGTRPILFIHGPLERPTGEMRWEAASMDLAATTAPARPPRAHLESTYFRKR